MKQTLVKNKDQTPSVVVLIPIYQSVLTDAERISLRQCVLVLGKYTIRVVKPEELDLAEIKKEFPSIEFTSFEDKYFESIKGYNELLTSRNFYQRFISFDYILIYQLDAFVFRDELEDWCTKGFDYVGSPTLHPEEFDALPASAKNTYSDALSNRRFVLNGGLSLRKVQSFLRYLKIYNRFYPPWKGNEDMLFSQEATRLFPMKLFMKLPSWQEAIHFSFEKSPAATFELAGKKLPFACHAWERYDPEFWKSYIAVT